MDIRGKTHTWVPYVLVPLVLVLFIRIILTAIPHLVDEAVFATTCELAHMNNYSCEEHFVVTEDGYILTIHRISAPSFDEMRNGAGEVAKPKPVALLMHCLECDSSVYLTNTPEEALGYILPDAGVDLWMGNFRGTKYSSSHVNKSIAESSFWNFSWQEMAWYDLPAITDYIIKFTEQEKLYYIGHSQGTLTGFAQMSLSEEFQSKVAKAYMLSPFVTLQNMRSPVRHLLNVIDYFGRFLGDRLFVPLSDETLSKIAVLSCSGDKLGFCVFVYNQFSGYSNAVNFNSSRLTIYFSHALSGTSLKNIRHYAQFHLFKNATYFDHYDKNKNHEVYNSSIPPLVDVTKVSVPVALFAGQNDWLVSQMDVEYLKQQLPNVVYFKTCHDFSHLDFIWGDHADECSHRTIADDILLSFQN